MALVSLAAGVLALAAFLLVVLRERGLRSRRLVWSEAAAVLGGVAAVLVMQRVTHSGFGDIGGPIDWVVGIAIFAAGGLGALVATYAALGVARRLADTASPGDTAGRSGEGKARRRSGAGAWGGSAARPMPAARIPDRRHECLRTLGCRGADSGLPASPDRGGAPSWLGRVGGPCAGIIPSGRILRPPAWLFHASDAAQTSVCWLADFGGPPSRLGTSQRPCRWQTRSRRKSVPVAPQIGRRAAFAAKAPAGSSGIQVYHAGQPFG